MKRILAFALLMAGAALAQPAAPNNPPPFPDWKDLKFPALRSPNIPKPDEFTLPNGMRVYLLEDH